ncbi:hypothetical protein [Bosea sp. (in: a-proteobacteria)]|uniref:hypothetical protein n=1 Tax=Bosea sp. (in: a-proteobacteria) TaxID=1871050 RepID=UPI003F718C17
MAVIRQPRSGAAPVRAKRIGGERGIDRQRPLGGLELGLGRHRDARAATQDIGLDHNVRGAADHHQMLDIVAPDQHQLTLPVEVVDVDHAEAGLACPAPALAPRSEAPARDPPQQEREQRDQDEDDSERDDPAQAGR